MSRVTKNRTYSVLKYYVCKNQNNIFLPNKNVCPTQNTDSTAASNFYLSKLKTAEKKSKSSQSLGDLNNCLHSDSRQDFYHQGTTILLEFEMGRRARDIKLHRPVMLVTGYLSKPHISRRAPGGTAFPSRVPSKNLPESRFTAFQKAFKFIDSNSYVINLGSAPGVWAKAISRLLRYPRSNFSLPVNGVPPQKTVVPLHLRRFGFLCSIDLMPMIKGIGTHFIQGDFRSTTVQNEIELMEECRRLSLVRISLTFMSVLSWYH